MAFVLSAQHIDVPETNRVIQFPMDMRYASHAAFPALVSEKLSNKIWKIDDDNQLRLRPGVAGVNGQLPRVHYRTREPLRFKIQIYGWEVLLGNIEEAATDSQLEYRRQQVQLAANDAVKQFEYSSTSTMRASANYAASNIITKAAGQRWDDLDSVDSDPVADLMLAIETIERRAGLRANAVVMTRMHLRKLKQHRRVIFYAYNKMGLSKDRMIGEGDDPDAAACAAIEALVGLLPGSITITNAQYEKSSDGPSATSARRYYMGPDVWVGAVGKGTQDGLSDNSWGYGRYLGMVESSGSNPDFPAPPAGGNEGIAVFSMPVLAGVPAGGQLTQVVMAKSPIIHNAAAAVIIKTALDSTRTEYNSMLSD